MRPSRRIVLPHDAPHDLVLVEVVRGDRPLGPHDFEEPLPDWLDLLLCVLAPTLLAIAVFALFRGLPLLVGALA